MSTATQRRLLDELNIDTSLEFVYKFAYQANFDETGSENELCHVYVGNVQDNVVPNEHEIAAIRYVAPAVLQNEFETQPDNLTPWFKMEWLALTENHRQILSRYCDI